MDEIQIAMSVQMTSCPLAVLLTAHLRAGWRRETGASPHEGRPFVWHVTWVSGLPSFSEGVIKLATLSHSTASPLVPPIE